ALTAAGLTGRDDPRLTGVSVRRHEAGAALRAAHRTLDLAVAAAAASACAAGLLAVAATRPWTVPLTASLTVVLLLRARAYPPGAQSAALLAAAVVLLVRLAALWADAAAGPAYAPPAALGAAA
ncbi:type VII secretion integral membrane protein EccD, partial [Streptomyces sp. B1866]|nr:type VII secretion integral membrane protein EccD [Streptomyces sp. B1866]